MCPADAASVGRFDLLCVGRIHFGRGRMQEVGELAAGLGDTALVVTNAGEPGDGGVVEAQASSGVLVGTGTGATGWLRSVWQERGGRLSLPAPAEDRLLWFVREAWPSPATGTSLVAGELRASAALSVTVESDRLIAFGDGIESDALELTWGQTVRVGVCGRRLRLVG